MLEIRVKTTTQDARKSLQKLQERFSNIGVFHHQVTRPFLLRQFGIEYHASGGRIQTGRLLDSLTNPTHPDHISEQVGSRLVHGTRVPYAIYVERRRGFARRVARSRALLEALEEGIRRYIRNG